MSNRVVHFEIPCDNPERVMDFFSKVFQWKFQQFGTDPYWLVMTGDEKLPGINGGLMKKNAPGQTITNTIDVEDIDQIIEKIKEAGGTIVMPKSPIPAVGWIAFFKDPDGNTHGVHQTDPNAG